MERITLKTRRFVEWSKEAGHQEREGKQIIKREKGNSHQEKGRSRSSRGRKEGSSHQEGEKLEDDDDEKKRASDQKRQKKRSEK
jgi:hypothetical protein